MIVLKMFNKKTCKKCGEKISDKYNFCPHCSSPLNADAEKEDWGMLGKNDFDNDFQSLSNNLFGGISGGMLNKMLSSALKILEKEMKKEVKNQNFQPKTNIRLMINGKEINLNNQNNKQNIAKTRKINEVLSNDFSQKNLKKYSKFKKIEPKTNIRRFSDKIVYEISMPGVESQEDISIMRLESSMEIKAVGKNKAYLKVIPINFPITKYNLSNGKLVLELNVKN